ncbi:hypothetical protein GCM10029964_081050 [Kibdelosporangium lantanae]
MALLLTEFFDLYQGKTLPPVVPYREYLGWLARQDTHKAELAWQQALDQVTPTRLGDGTVNVVAPEQAMFELSETATAELTARLASRDLTLSTAVHGAWAILLSTLTGTDDVVFGTVAANRPPELDGVERMVGMLVNTLPLRTRLNPGATLIETLSRLQADHLDLTEYQYIGLSQVQRGTGPLFDTCVAFENFPFDADALHNVTDELTVTAFDVVDATHYPLYLVAHVAQGRLKLVISHRTDLFDAHAVKAMGDRLTRVLAAVTADLDQPLGRVDLLTPAERYQILTAWNVTPHEQPKTFPELFDAQVARTPDAVAVESLDETLTYAQLDARANALAGELRSRGIGRGQVVAQILGRSVESVVASVAVLKAGAAYLPIDPDYPADRIAFMIDDARPSLVLTTDLVTAPPTTSFCGTNETPTEVPQSHPQPVRKGHSHGHPGARTAALALRTPPTSSTPPARPAPPRVSSCPTEASPPSPPPRSNGSPSRPVAVSSSSPRPASTPPSSNCAWRCCQARPSSFPARTSLPARSSPMSWPPVG